MTNSRFFLAFVAFVLSGLMSSCSVIGDIFEAGVWVGIIIVVGIIALIVWGVSKMG